MKIRDFQKSFISFLKERIKVLEERLILRPGQSYFDAEWKFVDDRKDRECGNVKLKREGIGRNSEGWWHLRDALIINRKAMSMHSTEMVNTFCFTSRYRPVRVNNKDNHYYSLFKSYLTKRQKIVVKGRAILLGCWVGDIGNYFHTWCDSIGDYAFTAEYGNIIRGDELFLITTGQSGWEREIYDYVGLSGQKIKVINEIGIIKCNELFIPVREKGGPNIPGWLPYVLERRVKTVFRQRHGSLKHVKKLIFLHRGDSKRRVTDFEDDILARLSILGFEKILASEFTIAEQIALFQNADVIVGVHGAGFTNIVFARKGCVVIEIFDDVYNFECFKNIAVIKQMRYLKFVFPLGLDILRKRMYVENIAFRIEHFLNEI